MSTTTWPSPAEGRGCSSTTSVSRGPSSWQTTARMARTYRVRHRRPERPLAPERTPARPSVPQSPESVHHPGEGGLERLDVGAPRSTSPPTGGGIARRPRPWPRGRVTARGSPTNRTIPSGRPRRPGRARGVPARPRPPRRPGTRGGGAGRPGRRTGRHRPPAWPPGPAGRSGRRAVASSSASTPGRASARRRGTEADGTDHVLESGPAGPLLLPADQERLDPQSPAHDERPDAGRPAQLVGRHRHQVGVERTEVADHVPGGGHRVHVDGYTPVTAEFHHLGHRLDRAHFVIGPLAVHQRGVVPVDRPAPSEGLLHRDGLDPAVAVHGDRLDRRRAGRGVADGRVLDAAQDHRTGSRPEHSPHGGVDRLGSARRQHHLAGTDTEQLGHLARGRLPTRPGPSGLRCGPSPGRR